jgi:hypothetical protein
MLHYPPVYIPQDELIERVWWHLHEQIPSNHRWVSMSPCVRLAHVENIHYFLTLGLQCVSVYPIGLVDEYARTFCNGYKR